MIGIYFSGSGNTKFCLTQFLKLITQTPMLFSIEYENAKSAIKTDDTIILAYPIYFSNMPDIMENFIKQHKEDFCNKKVFIIATMGLFSGDGTGVGARLLKDCGAIILGGLHIRMPDCIADEKILIKPLQENKAMVVAAQNKIVASAASYLAGKPTKEGLNFFYHIAGLFGQRLWFKHKFKKAKTKLKINQDKCIACGYCVKICPVNNLVQNNLKIETKGICTLCYRCVNSCPNQAITLLGKTIYQQHQLKHYL